MSESIRDTISAEPTKAFFVDMLVRDIPLEQAVLDLVDNCIDGAKRMAATKPINKPYEECAVEITMSRDQFRIWDSCGGFDTRTAREYAFRFGRPKDAKPTAHSIGQFGVGMKRALFKFGKHFGVQSATTEEIWAVDVDVDAWVEDDGWHFPWADIIPDDQLSKEKPGTRITVTKLRAEVADRFNSAMFVNSIIALIKSKHRQFISGGLSIRVNGIHVDATNIFMLVSDGLRPGSESFSVEVKGKGYVDVKIIAGVGQSSPKEAGWNVICNGRVILEADRRQVTGWGLIEEEAGKLVIPAFHNQFSRFRGIVSFECDDASCIPWNTTKTDIDQDSPVWRQAFARMREMMRPVIDFLNELDRDIDEFTRDDSPLLEFVSNANPVKPETLSAAEKFTAPSRNAVVKGPRMIKVQYSRKVDDVEFLRDALGVASAKAVGETCFDMILRKQRG